MTYLDLDLEFLFHIVKLESWHTIYFEGVHPDLIDDSAVRTVYEWQLQHMREYGKGATPTVLQEQFAVWELDFFEPETTIGDCLNRLRERYARNQGRDALDFLIGIQRSEPLELPRLLIHQGRQIADKMRNKSEAFGTGTADHAWYLYNEKVLRGRGASFGFEELNDHFFGMQGVNFIIGAKKTFKSWIMCQVLLDNVLQGKCVWLYPLELPAHETDMRIRHLVADVPWWKYIRNALTDEDRAKMNQATDALDASGIYHVVKPEHHHRGIDEMVQVARDNGADVILIDQLQYVETADGKTIGEKNETGDYWQVLNRARDLSDEGPILFAHQFNRQAMFMTEMPPIEYAKGSASIEEVATLGLGLWADKDMRRSNILQIGTLVARNHGFADWQLGYDVTQGCRFDILGRIIDDGDSE